MNSIKIYAHYNSLKAFQKGEWINAKMQFVNQYDVELFVDLDKVEIAYQQSGFTVRKKKLFRKK